MSRNRSSPLPPSWRTKTTGRVWARAAASSAYTHAVLVAFCAAAVVLLLIAALAAFGSRSEAGER